MRIVTLAPYGDGGEEGGVLYLLANYLRTSFDDVYQLRCNGVFSSCDRDAENGWKRSFQSCFSCMHQQSRLSEWAGLGLQELSHYLNSDEIERTKQWAYSVPTSQLLEAKIGDTELWSLISGSFWNRFGVEKPDLAVTNQEQFVRRAILSALRMTIATKRFSEAFQPNYAFVSGGWDIITKSFIRQAKIHGTNAVTFKWDLGSRAIHVVHPVRNTVMACQLVLQGLTKMRADPKTWPYELTKAVEDILMFLGIAEGQLMLPVAK